MLCILHSLIQSPCCNPVIMQQRDRHRSPDPLLPFSRLSLSLACLSSLLSLAYPHLSNLVNTLSLASFFRHPFSFSFSSSSAFISRFFSSRVRHCVFCFVSGRYPSCFKSILSFLIIPFFHPPVCSCLTLSLSLSFSPSLLVFSLLILIAIQSALFSPSSPLFAFPNLRLSFALIT